MLDLPVVLDIDLRSVSSLGKGRSPGLWGVVGREEISITATTLLTKGLINFLQPKILATATLAYLLEAKQ